MKKPNWTTFNEMLPWLLMPCCGCLIFLAVAAALVGVGIWIGS